MVRWHAEHEKAHTDYWGWQLFSLHRRVVGEEDEGEAAATVLQCIVHHHGTVHWAS
jgi:hypothetical protein